MITLNKKSIISLSLFIAAMALFIYVLHVLGLLDLFTDKQIQYHYTPGGFPPREEIERSPLRFTWEYRNPAYYIVKPDALLNVPVIAILDASDDPLPTPVARRLEGYRLSKAFNIREGIFRYSVGVRIYQQDVSFRRK